MKVATGAGPQRLPARVAAMLFAGLLAQACVDLWRTRQEAPEAPAVAVRAEPVAPPSGADVSLIIDRHLFGQPVSAAMAQAAPETRAKLVLGGIWFAAGTEGYALIGELGQRQRLYRVGAQLPASRRNDRLSGGAPYPFGNTNETAQDFSNIRLDGRPAPLHSAVLHRPAVADRGR